MKYITMGIVALMLAGCTRSTEYGRCVGLNGEKDPKLTYEYSGKNIFVAVFFFQLIAPPILVALNGLECPTGVK